MKTTKHYLIPEISVQEIDPGRVVCASTDSTSNLEDLQENMIWSEIQ